MQTAPLPPGEAAPSALSAGDCFAGRQAQQISAPEGHVRYVQPSLHP
jgi:hypothetical protein